MSNIIKLKKGSSIPTIYNLEDGEMGYSKKNLYYRDGENIINLNPLKIKGIEKNKEPTVDDMNIDELLYDYNNDKLYIRRYQRIYEVFNHYWGKFSANLIIEEENIDTGDDVQYGLANWHYLIRQIGNNEYYMECWCHKGITTTVGKNENSTWGNLYINDENTNFLTNLKFPYEFASIPVLNVTITPGGVGCGALAMASGAQGASVLSTTSTGSFQIVRGGKQNDSHNYILNYYAHGKIVV